MAIIKCPECGHQVSDKAPTCPSCGVEIAGNITRCQQCGAIYLLEQDECPICNHPNLQKDRRGKEMVQPTPVIISQPPQADDAQQESTEPKKKKRHWGALVFSFLMAVVICGVCFYFYYNAKDSKETEAFNYAITSEEPLVLQSFLDTYRDASASRRDSIQTRLTYLQQAARDWDDACVSQSKTELLAYLDKYPESAHKGEVMNKIDSIDWAKAKTTNTEQAYEEYSKAHPNGAHVYDADEALKELKLKVVQPAEKEMISAVFRKFFQSINSQNASSLKETVADVLSSFQGRNYTSPDEVFNFMRRMWKDDVMNLNWHVLSDYDIEKQLTETGQLEYIVRFSVREDIENADFRSRQIPYKVNAKVNAEGLISEFTMSKVTAQQE